MGSKIEGADIVPLFPYLGRDRKSIEEGLLASNRNPLDVLLEVMTWVQEDRQRTQDYVKKLEEQKDKQEDSIADLRLAVEVLKDQSRTDPLTGAGNRRAYQERLQEEFARATRHEDSFSLLYLDLDHFKKINDQYGHKAGDDVLVETVRRMQENVRKGDILCRLGGEEFALIAPYSKQEDGLSLGEKLCRVIAERPFIADSKTINVTGSIGVVSYNHPTEPGITVDELGRQADSALYQAKRAGRNQVRGYSCEQ